MTRLEFLEDTVAYYSEDVNRRAVVNGTCCYRTEDGRCCAIGRFIEDKDYDESFEDHRIMDIFNKLSQELQSLDKSFLSAVQDLHDDSGCWNTEVLSDEGLKCVEFIKYKYCNE